MGQVSPYAGKGIMSVRYLQQLGQTEFIREANKILAGKAVVLIHGGWALQRERTR